MNITKQVIPIFFSADESQIPFLSVAISSLVDNVTEDNLYLIKILYTNISEKNKTSISKYEKENVKIEFIDLNYYMKRIENKIYIIENNKNILLSQYFRLFIPNLYPQYDKVIYLDADVVLLSDISKLFEIDVKDKLLAGASSEIVQKEKIFQEYVKRVVGVSNYQYYFDDGVLLLNLDELRNFDFENKIMYLLDTIKFQVGHEQDYLNHLCKGKIKLLKNTWNKMPLENNKIKREEINLIHYNISYKPWHFEEILYKEYFWEYAKKTEYFNKILQIKNNYTDEDKFKIMEDEKRLKDLAKMETECVGNDNKTTIKRYIKKKIKDKIKDKIEETDAADDNDTNIEKEKQKEPPKDSNKIETSRLLKKKIETKNKKLAK